MFIGIVVVGIGSRRAEMMLTIVDKRTVVERVGDIKFETTTTKITNRIIFDEGESIDLMYTIE